MDTQWLTECLGKPWRAYATGPDAWDCYGLVVHGFDQLHGVRLDRHIDVPTKQPTAFMRAVAAEISTGKWQQIPNPAHGCVVLLATGTRFSHIGLWLDINGGRLLHSREGCGVCLEGRAHLSTYNTVEFWDYVATDHDL